MSSDDTYTLVQAAMLDADDEPEEEIKAALTAVATFALDECEMTREGFLHLAEKAWKKAEDDY